jgi:signal transduction histidine kinase
VGHVPAIVNFLRGPDLVFQSAHPETIRRLGGRDIIGKPLLEAIPEYRDQPFPQILRRVLETGEPYSASEILARLDRDGSGILEESYWNVVYQPVRSASGAIDGVMTFDLEVTEQVLARKKIEEQTAALEKALQRAADNDHRKNEFLATLAHELRNPLGPVMNSLEVMKRAHANPDLVARARATIERQVLQMKRLIDDLLDVSRITQNQIEIKKTLVNLGDVLEHALEASRPICEAAGHTLSITPLSEPLFLEADPDRLTQVFDNLFTNACKYTDFGGRIDVTIERQGSDVVVRVNDNGIGIPRGMLSRVFERFVQLDRRAERGQGGLGIGLALARQLVELHGGTVTAHSEGVGRGSEFVVRLPILTTLPAAHDTPPAPTRPIRARTLRILLVDDNRDLVESLALLLTLAGYETKTVHDGLAAVEEASAYRPDVVLLDIGLPKMSGYDVCRRIRAESWGRAMVVIAITGWGHEDDRRRTADAGFNAHLVKPVDYAHLLTLLPQ